MKDQKSSGKYISEKPNAFMLKPDISFWENGNCKLIIDTKYKLLDDTDDKKYGVSQSDAYQMYAYAMKYDCERVILLYPQHLEGKTAENDFGLGSGKTLEIRTVDICRDLKEDSMKPNEENSFRNELKNILNNKIGVEDGISSI
jgi:5-methylcytosine-specific restriction enzyme subunit McrC